MGQSEWPGWQQFWLLSAVHQQHQLLRESEHSPSVCREAPTPTPRLRGQPGSSLAWALCVGCWWKVKPHTVVLHMAVHQVLELLMVLQLLRGGRCLIYLPQRLLEQLLCSELFTSLFVRSKWVMKGAWQDSAFNERLECLSLSCATHPTHVSRSSRL